MLDQPPQTVIPPVPTVMLPPPALVPMDTEPLPDTGIDELLGRPGVLSQV